MKHQLKRFSCLGGSAAPARDEPAAHPPAEHVPDAPQTRRQVAKAALKSALRRPGAQPRVPMVPVRLHPDTVSARPRKLPNPFGLSRQAGIDKEIIQESIAAPTGGSHADQPALDLQPMEPPRLPLHHAYEWEANLSSQLTVPADTTPVFSQAGACFAPLDQQVVERAHRRLTLVTRWQVKARETPAENTRYGIFMAKSVQQTAHDLSTGKIDNFDQLWRRARDARLNSFLFQKKVGTADRLVGEDAKFYQTLGLERQCMPLTTPIAGRYGYIKGAIESQIKEILRNGKNTAPDQWVLGDLSLFHNTSKRKVEPGIYELHINPPGNPPPEQQQPVLWNIETFSNTGTLNDFDKSSSVILVYLVNPAVTETLTVESFAKTFIHAQAQTSITNALQATGRDDILDHAFEAYWTLVMSAPDTRGSAAKSHYVLQSVLLAKGIDLPPAGVGLAPDLEAMSRSRDAWLMRAREVFAV